MPQDVSGFVPYTGATSNVDLGVHNLTVDTNSLFVDSINHRIGMGTLTPTAALHLKAGTATANTAPLKLTSGTLLTTPEAGAMEYNGTNLYFTLNTIREILATKTYTDTKLSLSAISDTKEISGFVEGSSIDVSYNHTNRTITLTGNLDYYWRGVKYTLTSP